MDEIPFTTSVAWRVAPAALVLLAWLQLRGLPLPRGWRIWGALLGMGVLNNAIPFTLMAWGQLHIETGLTSILNAGTAVFGVLAAALLLPDERLTIRRTVGVALGFLGVATAIGLRNLLDLDLRAVAQLAVVVGTLSYALAGVWARRTLAALDPQVQAAGMLVGSSAVMIPIALLVDGWQPPRSADAALAVGYYAIVATALAYLLYFRVLRAAGSGNTMLCTLLIAPVAIVLGVVARDETLAPSTYLGFAVLALGLAILDGRPLRALRVRLTGRRPAATRPE